MAPSTHQRLPHVSVLLRVTLNRRLAELSFRGVDFRHLPWEVVKCTKKDFDTVCGAMAAQLAALFAFLTTSQELLQGRDHDLALCADPTYWLYGLLSFCAKSCEAKTTSNERKQAQFNADSGHVLRARTVSRQTGASHRPCTHLLPSPNCAQGHNPMRGPKAWGSSD